MNESGPHRKKSHLPVCTSISGCWYCYKSLPNWLYLTQFYLLSISKGHFWQDGLLTDSLLRLYPPPKLWPDPDIRRGWMVPSKLPHWMHYLDEGAALLHECKNYGWCLNYDCFLGGCIVLLMPLEIFEDGDRVDYTSKVFDCIGQIFLGVAAGAVGEKFSSHPPLLVVLLLLLLELPPLVFLLIDLPW